MAKYTVEYQQFGVKELDHFRSSTDAKQRYAEVCADPDTTLAYLFDGLTIIEEYWPERQSTGWEV